MALTIKPLSGCFVAEISGVDLAQPVPEETAEALKSALGRHLVLVFHDQCLDDPETYLRAAGSMGKPMLQHYSQFNLGDQPFIGQIHHREGQRPAEMWHTDHTNHERPPKATMLYGVSVPGSGGDTSVADMRAAYRNLSEDKRRQVDAMQTVNAFDGFNELREEDQKKYGAPVVHPLVRTHPETGEKALYFHATKARNIVGMTPEDSRAFLQDLLQTAIRPEIVYRHKWRAGDLLVMDNRGAVHRAHGDYDRVEPRVLHRIILEGDRPR